MANAEIRLAFFAFRWVVCLLVREFSFENVLQLWDAYVAVGEEFVLYHMYTCTRLIVAFQDRVMGMDLFPLVDFMQHLDSERWDAAQMRAFMNATCELAYSFATHTHISFSLSSSASGGSRAESLQARERTRREAAIGSDLLRSVTSMFDQLVRPVERSGLVRTFVNMIRKVLAQTGAPGERITPERLQHAVGVVVVVVSVVLVVLVVVSVIKDAFRHQE